MALIATLFRLVVGFSLVLASAFLATTNAGDHKKLRIAAAVCVGIPVAWDFLKRSLRALKEPDEQARIRVTRTLYSALVEIYRQRTYDDDITLVSFNVWVVPTWYRRLVPRYVRHHIGPRRRLSVKFHPPLKRLAAARWDEHVTSGLTFRKGVGLVGRCIELNKPGKIIIMRFDSTAFRRALTSQEEWDRAPERITQNMRRSHAQRLADSYSEAAAIVIRETSGQAIGCVLLEFPKNSRVHFGRPEDDSLLQALARTSGQVANLLTI